jgi:hypothetical protein
MACQDLTTLGFTDSTYNRSPEEPESLTQRISKGMYIQETWLCTERTIQTCKCKCEVSPMPNGSSQVQ